MTRAAVIGAGLRGPGQVKFPDQAKALGAAQALTGSAVLLDPTTTNVGGVVKTVFAPRAPAVPARLDSIGGSGTDVAGDRIVEASSHIISMPSGTPVSTKNRIEMHGTTWVVTADREQDDSVLTRVEVKVL